MIFKLLPTSAFRSDVDDEFVALVLGLDVPN